MRYVALFLIALLVCTSYGCPPKVVTPDQQVTAPSSAQGDQSGTDQADKKRGTSGITEEDLTTKAERDRLLLQRQKAAQEQALAQQRAAIFKDIRFEYDSYSIKGEDLARLKDIGVWLQQNKETKLTVEGHCDERGTQEYNLALGQKRADVVRDYLVKLGADEKRIKAISYGKEAPLDPVHSEDAWAKNRRAHFNFE